MLGIFPTLVNFSINNTVNQIEVLTDIAIKEKLPKGFGSTCDIRLAIVVSYLAQC